MKLETYRKVIQSMRHYGKDKLRSSDPKEMFFSSRDMLTEVVKSYPAFSIDTLGSIFAQDYQSKMKRIHCHYFQEESQEHLYRSYLDGVTKNEQHILLGIAKSTGLSPALLARMILEKHLSRTVYEMAYPPKPVVSKMMKEPCLIEDSTLSKEVHECIICDDQYGAVVDSIKHSVGHEYECKLKSILTDLGIAYIDEDQMRDRGYDKTPDCKLEVPFSVDGHVVNWIESKASFGDEANHKVYLKEQFWSYWNRFGPGMVIYWFGFIDELDVNQAKGILLRDSFPDNIVTML